MKNILIITNTRDNLGSAISFVEDISLINDDNIKNMILNYGSIWKAHSENHGEMWVEGDMCGSDGGYIFNDYYLRSDKFPLKIEHIINYVF